MRKRASFSRTLRCQKALQTPRCLTTEQPFMKHFSTLAQVIVITVKDGYILNYTDNCSTLPWLYC